MVQYNAAEVSSIEALKVSAKFVVIRSRWLPLFSAVGCFFIPYLGCNAANVFESVTSTNLGSDKDSDVETSWYDNIVVGGGTTGCPFARTLAESGETVLLIERGGPRTDHPDTLDIYGGGMVINDEEVAQRVESTQGVLSHIGSVLSGGTALSMGISIHEVKEWFDLQERSPGVLYDYPLFSQAFDWVAKRVSRPMPETPIVGRAIRRALELAGFGFNMGPNLKLDPNATWQGYSIFDSNSDFYRNAADVLLGTRGGDMPSSLDILLKHTVSRVEVEDFNGHLRATCVVFAETTPEDKKPLGSMKESVIAAIKGTMALCDRIKAFMPLPREQAAKISPPTPRRVCVRPGGEIILSAGAILTPVLLYKSGVGPEDSVRNSGARLILEEPKLGTSISDRVLIPVGMFRKAPLTSSGFPPRICQSIAAHPFGEDCTNYRFGQETETCTLCAMENLEGGRLAEGIIYATRFIFPPSRRPSKVADWLVKVVSDCAAGKDPFKNHLNRPMCAIARPTIDCFRKVVAQWYLTAEPKSRGSIQVLPGGGLRIDGSYLKHPQDLRDAVRGVGKMLEMNELDTWEGVFETPSARSCPNKILNGLSTLMTKISMEHRATMTEEEVDGMSTFFKRLLHRKKRLSRFSAEGFGDNSTVHAEDVKHRAAGEFFAKEKDCFQATQRYATYPPALPKLDDPECLAGFAKSWMTSIWHWNGSAKMGEVVDHTFRMKRIRNLSIVDASVINQITRMNPRSTLYALGRYAGLLRLREKGVLHKASN